MSLRSVLALAIALALCGPITEASARTKRHSKAPKGETVLLLQGMIGAGSYSQFHRAIREARPSVVLLQSPGGLLGESIFIADEVRRLGINTMVVENGQCASGCALIFLSGRTKYAGRRSKIGLHAASDLKGRSDGEATAVMAAYLSGVGVPKKTLARMAATRPSQISWLTPAEMKALRIRAAPPVLSDRGR